MPSDSVIPANQASGAYPRVEFESFDSPRPPAQPEKPETIEPPAPEFAVPDEQPELEPGEIAPGIRLPTAEDIEAMHQEAFQQGQEAGHQAGYEAGYEQGGAQARTEAEALHQLISQFDEALNDFDQEVAGELLALALEVARLVVRDSIAVRPESVLEVIREALGQTPQQHAQLHVHPEDAVLVRQHLGEQLTHTGHRIIEDASIERGGCRIDTASAQSDATVATRWRRVVETLSKDHPWSDNSPETER